ncbi:epsin 2-like protein [Jimgerdemannia flammicorona]|uniref:Epsin 2-like protein n=1 Tax=Jimgerdemannia flammicorona TaxID=994334 RepID=A0A433DB90_9FUNG|nr:epsin 2-like protein [Jimgerdemannia flammicorona]
MSIHTAKGALRSVKNYAKGYTDVQAKVREATSNDPWGPSGTLMNEIAQATYNQHDFLEIMEMLDKRLNDKGKNWRHVFKVRLSFICFWNDSFALGFLKKKKNYIGTDPTRLLSTSGIRERGYLREAEPTLKEFQHIDEAGKDVGANGM